VQQTFSRAAFALVAVLGPSAPVRAQTGPRDPGATRGLFLPSAFTPGNGRITGAVFDLAYFSFDAGIGDGGQAGLQFGHLGPLASYLGAQAKVAARGDGFAVALFGAGLLFVPFTGDIAPVAGAGPVLSVGDRNRFINVGFGAYSVAFPEHTVGLALPNAGFFWRLSRRLRLGTEISTPGFFANDALEAEGERAVKFEVAELWLIGYGARFVWPMTWLDLAFVLPICDGCGQVYRYAPIGIPLIGAGFAL